MKFISTGKLVAVLNKLNKTKRKSSTINWAIRKTPKQEHVAEGLQEVRGAQPLQPRIKGFHYWNGQYGNLRVLRDFFEETMSRFRLKVGNWYRILHMRKMHQAIGKKSTVEQWQIWLIVDSWIRNKEEPIPRSQAWSINASYNVSQSTWYVEKCQTSKEWFVRNFSGKMVHRCSPPKVIVWWRWDKRENQTVRRTCPGRTFPWSYTCRKGTMAKELEKLFFYKEGVEGKIRQRLDFREAKHAYRRLFKEHVESTGQVNKSIHPVQQRRQGFSTTIWWTRGVRLYGSPSNWTEILSFNKFVFVLAVAAKQ